MLMTVNTTFIKVFDGFIKLTYILLSLILNKNLKERKYNKMRIKILNRKKKTENFPISFSRQK